MSHIVILYSFLFKVYSKECEIVDVKKVLKNCDCLLFLPVKTSSWFCLMTQVAVLYSL